MTDNLYVAIVIFYRAVWTILLVLIHCIGHKKLDNSDFGRIIDGIAFVQMANNL